MQIIVVRKRPTKGSCLKLIQTKDLESLDIEWLKKLFKQILDLQNQNIVWVMGSVVEGVISITLDYHLQILNPKYEIIGKISLDDFLEKNKKDEKDNFKIFLGILNKREQ